MAEEKKVCPKCNMPGKLIDVGSATGRLYYQCTSALCKYNWHLPNPVAAASGALGGKARAAAMQETELSKQASNAAKARWAADKARRNDDDLRRAAQGQTTSRKL